MKKSNIARNNTSSGDCVLLLMAVLSILFIVLSPSPLSSSAVFPLAFALPVVGYSNGQTLADLNGNNYNNQGGDDDYNSGGFLGNLISQQQSPQADARNVNTDNKVIIVEDCDNSEIVINDNDEIIQTNTQSFNQEANNEVEEENGEEEEDSS
jgi:hypothetical protein